jgi:low temperature requirement protein LtrA
MSYASPAGAEFRIGNLISRAFEVSAANFPFYFIITLISSLPSLLIGAGPPVAEPADLWSRLPVIALTVVLWIVLNTIGEAVILYGAFQRLSGRPLELAAALRRAVACFLPLLGLALLSGLAIAFGSVLLVVPGVILFVMWAVAVPACVVERLGPIESMSRSAALTKGHRWAIFAVMLLAGIVNAVVSVIVDSVLPASVPMLVAIADLVWSAVWAVYWNCMTVMIYHDLRVAKEGVGTQQIASVFD